jgi:hypothetical protein
MCAPTTPAPEHDGDLNGIVIRAPSTCMPWWCVFWPIHMWLCCGLSLSRAFAKSQIPDPLTHLRTSFVGFFLVRFWAFLGKGSSKTPFKHLCRKSISKTFSKTIRQKFRCHFFLDSRLFFFFFFCLGDYYISRVRAEPAFFVLSRF